MRVIRSPTGSFNAIAPTSSPARLHEAGDHPLRAKLAQRDAAELELAVKGARPPAHLAAVAHARARGVARQLGELERGRKPLLHRQVLVAGNLFQARALAAEFLGELSSPIVLLDRALLRHYVLLAFRV